MPCVLYLHNSFVEGIAIMQETFSSYEYTNKKIQTRKELFLEEMEIILPWASLEVLIAKYYYAKKLGRPPVPLAKMIRVYCLQQWYGFSDRGAEEALYDMECMRRFCGFILGEHDIPDETTILKFRHLLEEHNLPAQIFAAVNQLIEEKGLLVKKGTIVDATIIHAPSSTKNAEGRRDPEMSSTKKNNQWYFGMKAHVGTDTETGVAHTLVTTTARVHDSVPMELLLHGEEANIYGDRAYVSEERKEKYEARGKKWRVQHKAAPGEELTPAQEERNWRTSRIRSRGEHLFRVVKVQFGYRKVRYKGLYKNTCHLNIIFALANLYQVRHRLIEKMAHPIPN